MKKFLVFAMLAILAAPAFADETVYRLRTSRQLTLSTASTMALVGVGNSINRVRLMCSATCAVVIGVSPLSATTSGNSISTVLAQHIPETFVVTPGETIAAAVISGTGALYITELSK